MRGAIDSPSLRHTRRRRLSRPRPALLDKTRQDRDCLTGAVAVGAAGREKRYCGHAMPPPGDPSGKATRCALGQTLKDCYPQRRALLARKEKKPFLLIRSLSTARAEKPSGIGKTDKALSGSKGFFLCGCQRAQAAPGFAALAVDRPCDESYPQNSDCSLGMEKDCSATGGQRPVLISVWPLGS